MNFIKQKQQMLKNTQNLIVNNQPTHSFYVQDVIDFSSQYGKEGSKSYTVCNIRGGPCHYPRYGDFLESCVMRTYGPWWGSMLPSTINIRNQAEPLFISEDFIEASFEKKLVIESVIIYETYNPGACVAIYAFDDFVQKWIVIWSIFYDNDYKKNEEARNRQMPPRVSRKFEPNLIRKNVFSNKIRIEFEHSKLEYYTEIDAVQIVGYSYENPDCLQLGLNLRNLADNFDKMSTKVLENDVINEVSNFNNNHEQLEQEKPVCTSSSESLNTFHDDANSRDDLFSSKTSLISSLILSEYKETRRRSSTASNNSVKLKACSLLTEMPPELLNIVISYLDLKTIFKLRSTCKFFYGLCSDESLYKNLNLKPYWHLVDDRFICLIKELTDDVRKLDLSWTKLKSSDLLEDFFKTSCYSLKILKLDNCGFVSGRTLKFICHNCPNITELSISSCQIKDKEEEKSDFEAIENLKNLTNLNLYRSQVRLEPLIKIICSCKKLKHLNLGSCSYIANYDLLVKSIAENIPHIVSLDLWRAYSLTHQGIGHLANSCFNLEYLDIGWCRNINYFDNLKLLIKNCKNLKKLFLTSLRVTDNELMFLSKNSLRIEQLDILGSNLVTLQSVETVLSECKNLRLFDISFCANIDTANYLRLTEMYTNCSIKKSVQIEA